MIMPIILQIWATNKEKYASTAVSFVCRQFFCTNEQKFQ